MHVLLLSMLPLPAALCLQHSSTVSRLPDGGALDAFMQAAESWKL